MRCATCGTENAPDSRFCGGCGAKQPGKTAPTAKILDDAPYPATGHSSGPASIPPSSYGHGPASIPPPAMPTPAPGSMVRPASIPPTNDPGRHISRPPDVSRPLDVSRHPSQPSRPNVSAPHVSRAPAITADESLAIPPKRSVGLIAIVLLVDLGLAAAGAVMLGKGLSKDKPAAKNEEKQPVQKTEADMTPAPAASLPSVPSASAIAAVADPAPAPAPDPAPSAAADKSSASRRAKEKERTSTTAAATTAAATTTPTKATVATTPTKTASTTTTTTTATTTASGGSAGPVTSPQDPYTDTTPAPAMTTEQEVAKQYARSKSAFDRCAAAAGSVHGQIQVAFQVRADGTIANATAVENGTGNTELGRCLAQAIGGWTLSPHSGSALNFVRPFNYP